MFKMNIYTKKIDMTLYNIVSILKAIAASQPNIRTTTDGSVYDALNTNPAVQYDVFHISQTNHREDENYDYYGFNLFYISRLEDSLEDNRLQIQSIGKEVLSNIIRTLCENWSIDYPVITYFPFTQRFNDLCAGVYCSLQLDVPKELWCADDYVAEVVPGSGIKLQDIGITITQNGLIVITPDAEYDGIGEIRIETNVPQSTAELQYKEVEYTENGEYVVRPDQDYDGLTEVAVSVDVPDRYEEGYDDGKEDGIAEQKAKLSTISVTENGTYTRADGYSAITVDVPQGQGYEEGYEDGVADQKAKLSGITITENGDYNREDGYSAITVNVPSDYQDGYEDGEAAQKAKLTVTSFTENNTYTREDGWSAVTVNVADRYDEGYADGEAAQKAKLSATAFTDNGTFTNADGWSSVTVNSPWRDFFITGITLNIDSAITDIGTATTTYSPTSAFTDIYYTSSDPTIAEIDPETGVITANTDGQVTICTIDRLTHMQDCKQVSVSRSSGLVMDVIYNVTSTTVPTQIFNNDNLYAWEGRIVAGRLDDDTPIPITASTIHPYDHTTGFTFPTTGLVNVHYTIIGDTLSNEFSTVQQLVSITVPDGITTTPGHFDDCVQLETAIVPSSLTGNLMCFMNCYSLTGITIPSGVTGLVADGFYNTRSLTSITIPSGITNIEDSCFGSLSSEYLGLTEMTFEGTVPPTLHLTDRSYGTPSLGHYNDSFPIYVPAEAYNDYITAPIWEEYAKKNRITAIIP